MLKGEVLKFRRLRRLLDLWVDKFQFISGQLRELRTALWTNTKPIDAIRRSNRAVAFHADFKTCIMQRADRCGIQLQQRFTASTDDIGSGVASCRTPVLRYRRRECLGGLESATAGAVNTNELGITKTANGLISVLLTSRPEVAASEAQKYGWPARVSTLALQCVIDFFN